jgi:hypothetical protein
MTDITLAAGLIARAGFASDARERAPRQEWLGPAHQPNRSTDQQDAAESAPLRLVGHKVLAQGAGRAPRNAQDPAAANPNDTVPTVTPASPQVSAVPMGASVYAARALASFSQQLRGNLGAKGTQIDTYA